LYFFYRYVIYKFVIFFISSEYIELLRPNPEGFVYTNWKEREGEGMKGRKQ